MAKRKHIKSPSAKQRKGIIQAPSTTTPNYDEHKILFSLERIQAGNYCFSSLNKDQKAAFADSIYKRKDLTWKEIKQLPRHGLGFEKIAANSIKPPKPAFLTEDVEYVLAFRFHGKSPMIGHRVKDIFYVLWFDHNFTVYKH